MIFKRFVRAASALAATAQETDVAATVQARAAGSAQIVDVREPDEWAGGHIPGALHVPLGELSVRRAGLDPARPVITVCRSGKRSLTAAAELHSAGFTDARSMAGGMNAWVTANQPVER